MAAFTLRSLLPLKSPGKAVIPLQLLTEEATQKWLRQQSSETQALLKTFGFQGKNGQTVRVPNANGTLGQVVCVSGAPSLYTLAKLAAEFSQTDATLDFALQGDWEEATQVQLGLGFALGAYRFDRYRKVRTERPARLLLPAAAARTVAGQIADAVALARDLVNTPTEDMGPAQLAQQAKAVAKRFAAKVNVIEGDALLKQNFPAIHAVGRASHRAPRLIELNWGKPKDPRICLVGKGVCFDTGGLDIKPADGMLNMKKDMGGAALALALAQLIMEAGLRVRLQVLLPAVENSIGPNAYRPGEVIATRAGHSVEIGNTDAEGRIVLCDALTYAAESKPELIIDFATLTGAARIALGPDLPATFGNDQATVQELLKAGQDVQDPLWPMPLWSDYQRYLDSSVADFNNAGSSRMGGAITAALYLQRFVAQSQPWVHIDTYCWNDGDRPGRPKGGECQSLRAAFAYLSQRFAQHV